MKGTFYLLLLFAVFLLFGFANYQEEGHPGKKVFEESKCQTCHSVQAEDLEVKVQKKKVVDLSNVGNTYTSEFIEDYLQKEEKVNEKTHQMAFKGTEEDLDKLVEWLSSLKNTPGENDMNDDLEDDDKDDDDGEDDDDDDDDETQDTTNVK